MSKYLSKKQRKELLEELRLEHEKKYADRIRVVLLLDSGEQYKDISKFLFIDPKTAKSYLDRYLVGGTEKLLVDLYRSGLSYLTESEQFELKSHLTENLFNTSAEVVKYIKQSFNVSYSTNGVSRLLKRLGFVYKKPNLIPGKANGEKQEEFVEILNELKESNSPLYFADGVHPQHNTYVDRGWIQKGEDFDLKSNTKRFRVNINGAINANNAADVVIDNSDTVNAQSTIRLLKKIERKNPEASEINVVVDNARYYRCKLVTKFLETSKVKLVFLPPYSPNLNLIERLWKVMNRKVLYNIYYEKLEDFRAAILGFFRRIRRYRTEIENILNFKFRIIYAE